MDSARQYIRDFALIVSDRTFAGLDLSDMHVKFSVKKAQTMTPNTADIRVYNLSAETATRIRTSFTRVILQAGYEGNKGVIFEGNIKQVIIGRESATETFIDIIAGDGDRAYNHAIVNTTLEAGATQQGQVAAAITSMNSRGVSAGYLGEMDGSQLPRGKVMFGNSREYIRNAAQTSKSSWSIQDMKVVFIENTAYLPGERVVLTSATGMIGTPQQTTEGINVKCLINPNIKVNGRIQIDNASIQRFKINLNTPNSAANIPAPITSDGVYFVLVIEHTGDNRGVDWYSSMLCLNVDVTSNPYNSVQTNYG